MANTGVSTIEMPALGRPFQPGMLYDCRSDTVIPGIRLWDMKPLKEEMKEMPKHRTEFQIVASNTMKDKALVLSLSGSLKASVLGGLVEVGGSAAFFNDTKKSKNHAQVSLHYSVTTKYKELTIRQQGTEGDPYRAMFDQGTATHVVTAVLYGAQAFFVFSREVSSSESVRKVEGFMKLMIEKIPKVSGAAEGSGEMKKEKLENTENLSCKFYGDFALERNPLTYQDALEVYSTLPKLLGDSGEKAVPVRVWLYPLSKLDSRAAQLVREISSVLVDDAQSALEHLTECDARCNDMEKDRAAAAFPEIGRKIQRFRDLCKQHRQSFQKELVRTLPSIHGGEAEEGALVEILTSKEQSPFGAQRLNEFLDKKQEELDFVSSYLAELEGVEVVSSRSELQRIVLSPKHDFVVSLTLTSLHDEEPYFSELNLWLRRQFVKKTHNPALAGPTGEMPNSAQWFEDDEIRRKARQAVKSFSDFARVNKSNGKTRFIVASVPDKANPGASIYLYENRELVSTRFQPPPKPLAPATDRVRHDRVQLTLKPAAYGRAEICGYRTEYRLVGQENWVAVNVSNTQETLTVTGLCPNSQYQFRYVAVSKPGLSESSDVSDTVKTLPASPPGKPAAATVNWSAIALTWDSPSVIGDGVSISEYKVDYKEDSGEESPEGKDGWQEKRTEGRTEFCVIDELTPETRYRFRVSAVCGGGALSTPSEESRISTHEKGTPELRIILVGKTGAGISATGNTILGQAKFESKLAAQSVTRGCDRERRCWMGRKILVVDTPGFYNTNEPIEETSQKIRHGISLSLPGPHAIILVKDKSRLTMEEEETFKLIKGIFGDKTTSYMIILFTRKDELQGRTLHPHVGIQDIELQRLITECKDRCCTFNNRASGAEREVQVCELINMIDKMVQENGGSFYTQDT